MVSWKGDILTILDLVNFVTENLLKFQVSQVILQ